jgi:N-acylneuraminate cytidylyltransferase
MNQNKIAIITARGGSKRIPRKNIKLFNGVPIIKYSIDAAINSEIFDEIMVSTDDEEIAEIAIKYGAKVPFIRSKGNSDDFSTIEFDYLCCIYPTAPFINKNKLVQAMNLLIEKNADCVLPIVKYGYPIQRSLKIEKGLAVMNWPENYLTRSQDLTPVFHDCGQFYCMKTSSLLTQKKLFADFTIPLEVSELEVQDIDNEVDWKLAELKFKLLESLNEKK